MSVVETRGYTEEQREQARRIVGEKCAGCFTAMEVALTIVDEFDVTQSGRIDAEREYDLRIGERCIVGPVALADVNMCIVDQDNPREFPQPELPKLVALD